MRLLKIEKNLKNAIEATFSKLNIRNVVIHRMNISKDLRYIRFFISSLSSDFDVSANLKLVKNLNKKLFIIKKELQNHISFKYQPEIIFEFDRHTARIDQINKIFKEIKEEETDNENDGDENDYDDSDDDEEEIEEYED